MYLLIYVNDMFICFKDMSKINKLKSKLGGEFGMKDFGIEKKILGMEIRMDRKAGKLYMSQKNYFKKVLENFGMQDSKHVDTPLVNHLKLFIDLSPQTEGEYMSHVPYASTIGSFIYGLVCTHSDISHAVTIVNMYMERQGKVY